MFTNRQPLEQSSYIIQLQRYVTKRYISFLKNIVEIIVIILSRALHNCHLRYWVCHIYRTRRADGYLISKQSLIEQTKISNSLQYVHTKQKKYVWRNLSKKVHLARWHFTFWHRLIWKYSSTQEHCGLCYTYLYTARRTRPCNHTAVVTWICCN